MELKNAAELTEFLTTYIAESADENADEAAARAFLGSAPAERVEKVSTQAKNLLTHSFPLEALGISANRWFAEVEEARVWLTQLIRVLDSSEASANLDEVKDSNGTVLNEGDSVTVIKDLKVRGGNSDLKRGTLVRKIHLIGDPENIECRVDGSTLVLKTCFLKKA